MKRSKIIASVILIGSLAVILFLAFQNVRPYVGVNEVITNPGKYDQHEIQVIGVVKDFTGGNFNLTDNTVYLIVDVAGASIPDNFTNGLEIVVTGIFETPKLLHASLIIMQCSQNPA